MGLIAFIKRFINSDFKKPLNKLIEETYGEISDDLLEHRSNDIIHVTQLDKNRWNEKIMAYVFETKADMTEWIENVENQSKLNTGDNLYIRDLNVPDYWWDGTKALESEAGKVDLSEYLTVDKFTAHEAKIATASAYGHIRLANSNVTTAGLKRVIPYEYITVANLANATINLNDYRLTHDYTIYLASGQTLQNFPSGWTASNANSAYLEVRMFYTSAGKQTLHKRGTLEVWERYFTSATAFGAWMKVGGG